MLRITRDNTYPDAFFLALEGTLQAETCPALRAAVADAPESSRIVLHLSGLRGTDDPGLALLLELSRRGIELASPSVFLQRLIQERSR